MTNTEEQIIAVDLDGTIIDFSWATYAGVTTFGLVDEAFVEQLRQYHGAGWKIIIHTCRLTPRIYEAEGLSEARMLDILTRFLRERHIPFHNIWTGVGKPVARLYIDDRSMRPDEFKQRSPRL